MNRRIFLVALCIMITVMATGCKMQESKTATQTGSQPKQIGTGRYVETPVLIEGFDSIEAIAADGNALIAAARKIGAETVSFFQVQDGQCEPLGLTLDVSNRDIRDIAVLADGRLALLCLEKGQAEEGAAQTDKGAFQMRYINVLYVQQGDDFAELFDAQQYSPPLVALPDGRFLLGDGGGLSIVSEDGAWESSVNIQAEIASVDGDTVYACVNGEGLSTMLKRHSFPDGKKLDEMQLPGEFGLSMPLLAGDSAGGAYLAHESGLYHINGGGNKLELLVEGASHAFGNPNGYLKAIRCTSDRQVYILCNTFADEDSYGAVYRYAWDAAAPVYEQVELTIVSMNDQYMIKAAASEYMRQHPNVKITFRSYLPIQYTQNLNFMSEDEIEEAEIAVQDAVRSINTEVLSGNAPDILLMDDMPLAAYAQKGYLDDMSPWLNERIENGTLLPNIAGGYRLENGALPCLPLRFAVSVLWGDRAQVGTIKTLDDFVTAAEHPKGNQLLDMYSARTLPLTLFPVWCEAYKDAGGKVQFTKEALSHFLSSVKRIQDSLPPPEVDVEGSNRSTMGIARGETDMSMMELGAQKGEVDYALLSFAGKEPALCAVPAADDTNGFRPWMIMSVSAGSPHKDIAYDFLDMMLSDMFYQNHDTSYGFSVVTSQFQAALDKLTSPQYKYPVTTVNDEVVPFKPMDEAVLADIEAIVRAADTPATVDYSLLAMLFDACGPYLEGKESLESVVDAFHGRVSIYLAE